MKFSDVEKRQKWANSSIIHLTLLSLFDITLTRSFIASLHFILFPILTKHDFVTQKEMNGWKAKKINAKLPWHDEDSLS